MTASTPPAPPPLPALPSFPSRAARRTQLKRRLQQLRAAYPRTTAHTAQITDIEILMELTDQDPGLDAKQKRDLEQTARTLKSAGPTGTAIHTALLDLIDILKR